jgi:hypothetical protein
VETLGVPNLERADPALRVQTCGPMRRQRQVEHALSLRPVLQHLRHHLREAVQLMLKLFSLKETFPKG